jgi:predicted amidohydrolase
LVARAIENQAGVVASNRIGSDPTLQYSGGSVAIDHLGHRVHECGSELESASWKFDRAPFDEWRAKFGALRDTRSTLLGSIEVTRS